MRNCLLFLLSLGMLGVIAQEGSAQVIMPGCPTIVSVPTPVVIYSPSFRPCGCFPPGPIVFGQCPPVGIVYLRPAQIVPSSPASPGTAEPGTAEPIKPPTGKTYKAGVKLLSFKFGEKPEFGTPLGNSSAIAIGDIVLEANGKPTTAVEELQKAVGDSVAGDGKLKLLVLEPSTKKVYSTELDVKKNRLVFESQKTDVDVQVTTIEEKRPAKK